MRGQYDSGAFTTGHRVAVGDARSLPLPDDSVALAVTSPPYPMIEQWDELFGELAPGAREALAAGDGRAAFDRMHEVLDEAWAELERVLIDGGIACVNVGDATRRLGDRFALYPNHARVSEGFAALGFDQLPGVLWRKPTNRPAKFMGSGTLPPNAYVTLEHEHVLVFRNGARRSLPARAERRYEASYFYENLAATLVVIMKCHGSVCVGVPNYDDEYARRKRRLESEVQDGIVAESDAERIQQLCAAFNEENVVVTKPTWPDAPSNLTSYRERSTLGNWMYALTRYARNVTLTDTSADALNRVAQSWVDGSNDRVNGSLTKGTVRNYQSALRLFYRMHDDLGVARDDIAVFEPQDTRIEPRDMLDDDEIQSLRDAPTHPRDKAVIDLLLYTGLRNTGLRTLRIRDIDLDDDNYYFNTEADGLKGVHRPNEPRPLLGAKNAVRTWMEFHPYSDDPDAYFITGKPEYTNIDPHEPLARNSIGRILRKFKDELDVDKPMHPHALRHNMVSICKREYDMDDMTVKFLIGHSPDSNVMESTYAHLTAADYADKAREAVGIETDDDDHALVPPTCDVCDEPLADDAKACPRCGTVYTADAEAVKEQAKDDLFETATTTDDEQVIETVRKLREAVDDPEALQQILAEASDD